MSAFNFYKNQGYSQVAPKHRTISNAVVASTITLWTPTTNQRIALTELAISSNLAGTIAFYFGGNNQDQKLAEFSVGSSSTIAPNISSWESTAINAPLLIRVSHGATNGWQVTGAGFELD